MATRTTERVSCYFTEEERESLRTAAIEADISDNGLIRMMVRYFAGPPLDEFWQARLDILAEKTRQMHR